MLEMLEDANDFVYETALRREREGSGIYGPELFILLCGKNPWFHGNQLYSRKVIEAPVLNKNDLQMLHMLLDKEVAWRNEESEGAGSFDSNFPIRFWLNWFNKQGIKLESVAYRKLSQGLSSPLAYENKWPWGNYETHDLRLLAEAVRQFWSTYDPSDKTTAPRNHEVQKWLESQGASKRTAEVIATIIRAEEVPAGRRGSK